ncbi:hypothetical protein IWQ60_012220 [Tieghemiomyces parasiticus]|uniref:Reverse transcriptase domain-containing protein n=1 Tax=Tieghemiomyces parasiticus TaxID=78921 RepID=A0A9W7ZP39_9FUNG|nr:hypothetical protein IWQ60_012220 [Tieghemiomyces parasiticus]
MAQAFLDFKAAYDTVPIEGMLSKLAAKGCPAPIFQVVKALFTKGQSRVAVNGNHPFLLGQGTIPATTPMYQYLGFPHKQDGIDWALHVQTTTSRATARLTALRFVAANWSPSTRLAVFKTLVLPVAEYGLPLVHLAIQAKLTPKKSPAPLHQLLTPGVSWVNGTCCPAVAHVMTGLPYLPERLVHLQVGFHKHMSQTP